MQQVVGICEQEGYAKLLKDDEVIEVHVPAKLLLSPLHEGFEVIKQLTCAGTVGIKIMKKNA